MLMPYLRKIWHFKLKKLLLQGIVNGSIANFFAILLQYNSKHRIALFTVLQKKKNILLLFPPKFLSHPSHFFCSPLSSFSVSPSTLSSLKLHCRNFSPISHGLSLIALVLGFGFLRLEVGLAWIGKLGLDRWVWNSGSVNWWVDRLG